MVDVRWLPVGAELDGVVQHARVLERAIVDNWRRPARAI